MRVGLLDVDGHNFPNIALMKLSAYHKAKGDNVEWANALFGEYDVLYKAKVFTFTRDDDTCYNAKLVIKGGTGYDLTSKLPVDVEHCYPDYEIYNIADTAYGYLTRGCPRGCSFCIVKDKEGLASKKVADLSEFWRGQKYIKLLDPNIVACEHFNSLAEQLIASNAYIDFTQGVDIRLMTDEKLAFFNKMKITALHFAWDNPNDVFAPKKLEEYAGRFKKQHGHGPTVYILTNFFSSHEQDLDRVYKLRDWGYMPYVMIYDKENAPRLTRLLQRWVNNKIIFHKVANFKDFDPSIG